MMAAYSTNSLRLSDLLDGFVALSSIADREIFGLTLDSRNVSPGDCFIALKGAFNDGAQFAASAIAAGASAVLVEDDDIRIAATIPVVRVPNLSAVAGIIASRFYGTPSESLAVIAVTGTNGKTTVAQLCAQVLQTLQGTAGYVGTLGFGLLGELQQGVNTTPDPVTLQRVLSQLREQQCPSVSLEVSSHAIHQCRVVGTKIDVAVFTNLGHDHLDYHKTQENYAKIKRSMFQYPGIRHAIINVDDTVGSELLKEIPPHVATWTYGCKSTARKIDPANHFQLVDAHNARHRQTLDIETPTGNVQISTTLLGGFNCYNMLAALAALVALGVDSEPAARTLSQVNGVVGRMQRIDNGGASSPRVIVDYAHTPESLALVLSALREQTDGRVTCVFGCGGDRDKSKRQPMGQAAAQGADRVIVTSDNPRGEPNEEITNDILRGANASPHLEVVHDREQAIRRAIVEATPGDVVLIAGKGHETYQLVDGSTRAFSDVDVARQVLAEIVK